MRLVYAFLPFKQSLHVPKGESNLSDETGSFYGLIRMALAGCTMNLVYVI